MSATLSRPLHRFALLLAAGLAVAGLSACSSDSVTSEDAYKIGCPALDAAVAGGSVANQAAIKGLQAIRDSGQLDAEPQRFVDAAITALESGSVEDMPAEARTLLVDGCADHGHPLKNLK